ncbi:ParB N-terminal domain-containing protein [Kiloniella majae]|uniref:ParB N-terminal domain-containing protein n=1 Tax=Kiloniella majae TaxID=1938558 RepID=UPI000A27953D|nr:ParB N-terminal domain-containing protein [Kiloniella majae]
MLKVHTLNIDEIYVPAGRRKEFDPEKLKITADKIMEETEQTPISVRQGKGRYVLLRGIHRLEARKALGETTIKGHILHAKQR